ncbi:STM4015 family protein [Acidovorax sp. NPDC077693]|uniref:STM4015 family protein n=1 Tax=unclassified Acidovorax TaxID=2684926 RepID=UPI0037C87089
MTISERTEVFFGKTVQDYQGGDPVGGSGVVHRLTLDYDDSRSLLELLQEYLSKVDLGQLEALVIGAWGEPHDNSPNEALDRLIELAPQLPNFKALFVGDMTYEECEISWIIQGTGYNHLLQAFPLLEALRIRGSTSLELSPVSHTGLRELVIESGGLPQEIAQALAQSELPALEKLELWLGDDNYGFEGDVALYRQVLQKLRTPALRVLGLRDSQIADELAIWLASEAWVASLDTLDLSLGTLGDKGAQALLASPHTAALKKLDLSHHYISESLQGKLRAAIPGVVLDDAQGAADNDRYVAVGE